jgi:hypothetical protein
MTWGIFDPGIFDSDIFDTAHYPVRGVGNGVQAIVYPAGQPGNRPSPYLVPLAAPPESGANVFGGYDSATVIQRRVSRSTYSRLLHADIVLFGRQGPYWGGIVHECAPDGTLQCVGDMRALGWTPMGFTPGSHTAFSSFMGAGVILPQIPDWQSDEAAFFGDPGLTLDAAIEPAPNRMLGEYISEVTAYSDWQWGSYYEYTGGRWVRCWHYTAPSQDIAYVVTLSAEDAKQFMGDSLEPMRSVIVTTWGESSVTTTTDTDESHYLVSIGRDIAGAISSPNTQSAVDAARIAEAELGRRYRTKAGKVGRRPLTKADQRRIKSLKASSHTRQGRTIAPMARMVMADSYRGGGGSESTSRIQLATGLPAYPPSVRPGRLARVNGPNFTDVLRILSTRCVGDSRVVLEFGVDSGNLPALLARRG